LGGKSFDFKRAAVFCKQINAFFSGDHYDYLADVSPIYSSRLPRSNVFNHVSCNLPIAKTNEERDVQKQKAQNRPTEHCAIGNEWQYATVNVEDKMCEMKTLRGDNEKQRNKIA